MTNVPVPSAIDTLLGETRRARHELHELVARLKEERDVWDQGAVALPRRTRLTAAQRQRLRRLLSSHSRRLGR